MEMVLTTEDIDPRGFLYNWEGMASNEVIGENGAPSTLFIQMSQQYFIQFDAEWNMNTRAFEVGVWKLGGRPGSDNTYIVSDKLRAHVSGRAASLPRSPPES